MKLASLKATHMDLTDAIRSYVEEKASFLDKLLEDMPSAELSAEVGKTSQHHNKGPFMRCEFNLSFPGGMLRAEEEREDLYEAIDVARDALVRQIKEKKDVMLEAKRSQRPDKEM